MSGGSWNYAFRQVEDLARQLSAEHDPLRRAFGHHLQKCADALKAIEWHDSADWGVEKETEALRAVVTPDMEADAAADRLVKCIADAEATLARLGRQR